MFFDRRLFAMTQGVRWRLALAALLGLFAVGAGVTRLALSGLVIARVFQGAPLSDLVLPLMAVAGCIALRGFFQYSKDAISFETAGLVKIRVRQRLYEHALALGPGHFDQRRTGDVLLSLVDGVEQLETFFGQYLPQLLVAAITPILIFAFMATLDWQIGFVFLAFALFTLIVPALLRRLNERSSQARRAAYGALGAEFLDSVQGLGTLKAFGQSRARGEMLAEKARNLYRTTMWVLGANIATSGVSMLGISAGAATALAWGAIRVNQGELPLATLVIVLMLGVEVFRPIRELVQLYHQGILALSSAQGIFALLDTPVEVVERAESGLVPSASGRVNGSADVRLAPEISFENVTFGYLGGQRPALHELSFTLRAGETLGLVGPSGAGKSTVVWLLLRFHDPQQGRITIGGHDLRELSLDLLRQQIAVVTQDTYLFHGTVIENLAFGKAEASRDEIERAARAANAHSFISALPQGYDTVVGERGVRLSGGQRQRIAIARALLKDAPILVLDEALSSVDAENEAVIQEALDRLMQGRTTLVIAHRLSSVVGADRILVLDNGRLAETGRHEALVASGGLYAQLMANQQTVGSAVETAPNGSNGRTGEVGAAIAAISSVAEALAPDGNGALTTRVAAPASGGATRLSTPALWGRLLSLVRPWWGYLSATFITGLIHHGFVIGLGVISALLVGTVATGGDVRPWLVALALFVPLSAFLTWAELWMAHDLAYKLLAEMRIDMYKTLEPLAPAYLVRRRSGDLVSIVGGDVETIELFFAHTITPAFVAVLVPCAVLVTLGFLAWPLAFALLPFLLAVGASPFFAQKVSERLGEEVRGQLGEVHAHIVDSVQGLREIVAFGRGPARVSEIVENGWRLVGYQHRLLKQQAFQSSFIETMTGLGGLAVLTTGAWLVSQDAFTRTFLPLVTLVSLAAFTPVSELARTAKELVQSLASARRVFEVQDEPIVVRDGPGIAALGAQNGREAPSVRYESLSFSYGPGEPQALQDVSFSIEPGQTVALVGRSGAGKTTAAHLLMRFWDPDTGRIVLGGHDAREFLLDDLRRQIALVSQDTYLFNVSLRENIRLGRPGASDDEIEQATRQANAHEFIAALPEGYDTPVGERGVQLSGGQRQRVAIARALLKDAPVLVLDEATSHLDAVNELQVRQALDRLMEGRTTLVIAHRLSTIRDADRIVLLDAGRVMEQGTHVELLAAHGLYAQLVATQLTAGAAAQVEEPAEPITAAAPHQGLTPHLHQH